MNTSIKLSVKILVFIFLFVQALLAQDFLLLMDDNAEATYPITADLEIQCDEREMTVSNWGDQSGNNRDWIQATATNQPTLTANALNGYSGLLFDGVDNIMSQAGVIAISQPVTVYFVMKQVGWTDNDFIFGIPAVYVGQGWTNETYPYAGSYGHGAVLTTGTYYVITVVFNGASTLFQVNDGAAGTTNAGGAGIGTVALNIGSAGTGTYANVELVALYLHSTAHDEATRTSVINFLMTKYGL